MLRGNSGQCLTHSNTERLPVGWLDVDHIVMLLANAQSIRDVIPFDEPQSAGFVDGRA